MYCRLVIILFFFLLPGIACWDDGEKGASPTKPASGLTDTLLVKTRGLFFYKPTAAQLSALRAQLDSSRYESLMHDYEFMLKAALAFSSSAPETKGLPVTDASRVRYLYFRMNRGDTLVDLDELGDPVGLFFFDPQKEPRLVDMANISAELPFYFNSASPKQAD